VFHSIKKVTSQLESVLSCCTSPFLQPTPILSPASESYCEDGGWDTTDWPSEMSNRSSLKEILHLDTDTVTLLRRVVLGKSKLSLSISSFVAPVAILQNLLVPSLLPETKVAASMYSSLVTRRAPENFLRVCFGPHPNMIYTSTCQRVLSLLNL